jgi:hypothetical protein
MKKLILVKNGAKSISLCKRGYKNRFKSTKGVNWWAGYFIPFSISEGFVNRNEKIRFTTV